jgi:hypothetical protein
VGVDGGVQIVGHWGESNGCRQQGVNGGLWAFDYRYLGANDGV